MTAFEKLLQDLAEQAARPDGFGLDWRGWYERGRSLAVPTDAVLPLATTTGEALYFATSLAETLVGPADIELNAKRRVGALREGLLSRLYEEILRRSSLGQVATEPKLVHHTRNPVGGDWHKTTCGITHAQAGCWTSGIQGVTCPECLRCLREAPLARAERARYLVLPNGNTVAPTRAWKAYILGGPDSGVGYYLDGAPSHLHEGDKVRVRYVAEDSYAQFLALEA